MKHTVLYLDTVSYDKTLKRPMFLHPSTIHVQRLQIGGLCFTFTSIVWNRLHRVSGKLLYILLEKSYLIIRSLRNCVSFFDGNILCDKRMFTLRTLCQGKCVFAVAKKHH